MSTEPTKKTVDIDVIVANLTKRLQRAEVFMGIGLNAARHEPPVSHVLVQDLSFSVRLVKTEITPTEQTHLSDEFRRWVIANGLRELVDALSIFLFEIYAAAYVIRASNGSADGLKSPAKVEKWGISPKIAKLRKLLNIGDYWQEIGDSLNAVRNCYAHRMGIVSRHDIEPDSGKLILAWLGRKVVLEEPDGTVVPLEEIIDEPLKNGGDIQLRSGMERREFGLGEQIGLAPQDLQWMALSILLLAKDMANQVVQQAAEAGILKEKTSTPHEANARSMK